MVGLSIVTTKMLAITILDFFSQRLEIHFPHWRCHTFTRRDRSTVRMGQHPSKKKPSVSELLEKIEAGDQEALAECWECLDRDNSGALTGNEFQTCVREVAHELKANFDTMDEGKLRRFAKLMATSFVSLSLDPDQDKKITKEEFCTRVQKTLQSEA